MSVKDLILRSPKYEEHKIVLPAELSHLQFPFSGSVSSPGGDDYPVTKNIVSLEKPPHSERTLAQESNFIPITASSYEDLWRKRSIKAITGKPFSIVDEKERLCDWLNPAPNEIILDLGASTALYARSLASCSPLSTIAAIDISMPMLKAARERAVSEEHDIFLLQADAEKLPFFAATVDKVAIGGSLNEFRDPVKALYETRRVLKKGGQFFLMYLMKAESLVGSALQKASGLGGLHFWSASESTALFERSGFRISREDKLGIVHFVLMEAV